MIAAVPVVAVSTTELTIRMVVALVVIGLLLVVLHRLTRRVLDGRGGVRAAISIRHQQRLDRHASVTLLRAGDRNLLIGTTGQSIVLLAEGDDLTVGDPARPGDTDRPTGITGSGTKGSGTKGSGSKGSGSTGAGVDGSGAIDVRGRNRGNPIRALQNKTVRRG